MATASRDIPHPVPAGLVAHPHVLREAALLGFMCASVLPFALHAAGVSVGPLATLAALSEMRVFRLVTGSVGMALVAGQLVLPALRRWGHAHPRVLARLQEMHALNGAPLLLIVLAHTGGRLGRGVLTWLLMALVGMLLVAQGGHLAKALFWWRAQSDPSPAAAHRNEIANTPDGWVHQSGLQLHVSLAILVLVLLFFHVLSVLYF
jgi:cytochrome b561